MDWFCISPFPFPRHRRNLSCISIVSYPLGKEEVGGGHIPCLKAVPGVAALRWRGGSGEGPVPHGIHSKYFRLSHTPSSSSSDCHSRTDCSSLPSTSGCRPAPSPQQLFLSIKSPAGKMSCLSLSSPKDMQSGIVHCKFSGGTAGTGREVV